MKAKISRHKARVRRKLMVRSDRPRLSVFRSNKFIYAQVINDEKMATVASAKGVDSNKVGEEIAKAAIKAKVTKVVFDRGEYKFHGRVKILAEAARKGGLKF